MGNSASEMPNIPDDWKDGPTTQADVGEYYFPGLGRTYLDPKFADKVGDFIQKAKAGGIPLQFVSGYRRQLIDNFSHAVAAFRGEIPDR